MSLLSFDFAIFLATGLLIFHLAGVRWRPQLLLALSYAFYASWGLVHTILLAAATSGVYATALWIEGRRTEQGKRVLMALGVAALLLLMFAFKSAGWLVAEFGPGSPHQGLGTTMLLAAPLGLSYYVFKMLGYLLDVYWDRLPAQRSFVSLALYGAFFPQIVSGPIQRADDFFNQLEKIKASDAGEFVTGLRRILFGLFKKVVIADQLAVVVDAIHSNLSGFSALELLFGAYCYAFQLYTDFSGITDIAIGIGQLFGFKGPENFDLPYLAPNLQVFWRRWHMSLTSWLADYLFMPLRMSLRRLGTAGLCLAIFINMTAIGLWHGLSWTFLAFGMIHGVYLTASALTLKRRNLFFQDHSTLAGWRKFAAPVVTFHLVVLALIFFRAENLPTAIDYVARLVPGWRGGAIPPGRFNVALLGVSTGALTFCFCAYLVSEAATWAMRRKPWIDWYFATPVFFRRGLYGALVVTVLVQSKETVSFIYARF